MRDSESKVSVDHYSELMQNYSPKTVADIHPDASNLRAIRGVDVDHPSLFHVSKSNSTLCCILRNEASPAGWAAAYISDASMGTVVRFDVHQNSDLTFALSLITQDSDNGFRYFESDNVNVEDLAAPDFDFSSLWTHESKVSDVIDAVEVSSISRWGASTLYSVKDTSGDAKYVCKLADCDPVIYDFPLDATEIIQIDVGQVSDLSGVFAICVVDGETEVVFQSFPDPEFGKTTKYRFSGDQGTANTFALAQADDGNSMLYVAGEKGISQFLDKNDDGTMICSDSGVSQLFVCRQSENISCWYLNAAAELQFFSNEWYDPDDGTTTLGKWNDPIQMGTGILDIVPIRGENISNHLFLIDHGEKPIHAYQSGSGDGLWRESTLYVSSLDKVEEIQSYTVHVTFESEKNTDILEGQKVLVSSDSDAYLTINEKSYHVGPNTQAEVTLPQDEALHICQETDKISAPTVSIDASFLDDTVEIDLSEKVMARAVDQGSTGDDIMNAKLSDGSSLIDPDQVSSDCANTCAEAISAIGQATDSIRANADKEFSVKRFRELFPVGNPDSNVAAQHFVFLKHEDGTYEFLTGAEAEAWISSQNSIFSKIGHKFGNICHSLESLAKKSFGFVISPLEGVPGINLIIKLAEESFQFALNQIESCVSCMKWVFDELVLVIETIIKWIGYLLEWEKVLDTHRYLVKMINGALESAKDNAANIQEILDTFYDDLKRIIGDPAKTTDTMPSSLDDTANSQDTSAAKSADPRSNWANSKSSYTQNVTISPAAMAFSGAAAAGDGIDDPWAPIADDLTEIGERLLGAITDVAGNIEDLVSGSISVGDFLKNLLSITGELIIDYAKVFTDYFIESFPEFIDFLNDTINQELKIPFFSEFYKFISGDSLTLLDLCCLINAVPMTYLSEFANDGKNVFEGFSAEIVEYCEGVFENDRELGSANSFTHQEQIYQMSMGNFSLNCLSFLASTVNNSLKEVDGTSKVLTCVTLLSNVCAMIKAILILRTLELTMADEAESSGDDEKHVGTPTESLKNRAIANLVFKCVFIFTDILKSRVPSPEVAAEPESNAFACTAVNLFKPTANLGLSVAALGIHIEENNDLDAEIVASQSIYIAGDLTSVVGCFDKSGQASLAGLALSWVAVALSAAVAEKQKQLC